MLPMLQYDPDRRATAADMLRHSWLARASGPALPCARDADALHAAAGPADQKVQGAFYEDQAEHGGGSGGGGGRHGAERRRAYSGRSRSRSTSPSHPRSRCGAFAVWLHGHLSPAQLHVVAMWCRIACALLAKPGIGILSRVQPPAAMTVGGCDRAALGSACAGSGGFLQAVDICVAVPAAVQ